ncbi:DUF1835 domain-containing protein [Jeotgalibacillus sp. ET6]|uniref:DUF1835 domain-containing protein n=1 Tax=Jeotgalibacillus sp. ET6 TaxID=3037260 RepID=UPI002418B789|nr:DUF1835 domain-containing protein [Jeotgalibacillus sp. ET6]MDG5471184.1 DUF1835 domain-containing protein [Jeotgalibacillus sp. ET6]
MDELKRMIRDATEEEVKAMLFQTFIRLNMLEETEKYTEKQFVADVNKLYNAFLHAKREEQIDRSEKAGIVHILFGDAAAGSVKWVLREMGVQKKEHVLSLDDLFSIGPVWQLHEKEGVERRHHWIKNHLLADEEYLDEYVSRFSHAATLIRSLPEKTAIKIWAGKNAHEQTGLRYVLYLLRGKKNDIFLVDTTGYILSSDTEYVPLHMGEMIPETLQEIVKTNGHVQRLTKEQRRHYEEEWMQLSFSEEVLRIWNRHAIASVDEAYYDQMIIKKAEKLQKDEFVKSARLIGEVYGHLDQYIGDEYIEYRLRHLIMSGRFEIEGVPRAMRFYSVKLK